MTKITAVLAVMCILERLCQLSVGSRTRQSTLETLSPIAMAQKRARSLPTEAYDAI